MFRKLLACLALLTGLTAASAPVQAEVAIAVASQIEASVSGQSAGPVATVRGFVDPRWVRMAVARAPAPTRECAPHQPAVRLRSDRARE